MSTVKLRAGVSLHNVSPDEFRGILREESAIQRAQLRGIKENMRIPITLNGTPAGGVLTIGETAQFSPSEGYVWAIRRILVVGLARGATPDVVQLYFNDAFNRVEWEFNGNNYGYTFSRSEMTMKSGDVLFIRGTGLAAVGNIYCSGQYDEYPAEMAAKLSV